MNPRRLQALRVALVLLACACLSLGPLMLLWPSGWRWAPYHPHYEQMIVGVYFTLGIFLLVAARDPWRHLSLIWFTVASSAVHAVVMTAQALSDSHEHGHLVADVPALFVAAAAVAMLTPRRFTPAAAPPTVPGRVGSVIAPPRDAELRATGP